MVIVRPHTKFLIVPYIGGWWVSPETPRFVDLINPATEAAFATFAPGDVGDVDRAVAAA